MRILSRRNALPVAAVAATALAAGPVLARDDPPPVAVPAPEALQSLYLEAEDLLPALESFEAPGERAEGVAVAAREELLGIASGNASVRLTNRDVGTRMTLRFSVPVEGAYGIGVRMVLGPDFGVVQPAIDGRPVGERVDLYAREDDTRSEELALGRLELARGDHTITFRVVGRNAAARGLDAGVDYLTLEP